MTAGDYVQRGGKQRPSQPSLPLVMSAAVPSAGLLGLVDLRWDGHSLSVERDTILALIEDDQESLLALADQVGTYVDGRVSQLLIQSAPRTGPRAGSHLNQKLEAVLALRPGLVTGTVNSIKVAYWRAKHEVSLPDPDPSLRKRGRDLLERTYATAAYAIFCRLTGQVP